MKYSSMLGISGLCAGILFFCSATLAQAAPDPTPTVKPKLPQTGLLSTSGRSGVRGMASDGQWGNENVFSNDLPPVTGSVSRGNDGNFVAKVFNNSEDRYSVDCQVIQFDAQGKKLKSDNFSVSLNSKGKDERPIRATLGADRAGFMLTKWRKFEKSKPATANGKPTDKVRPGKAPTPFPLPDDMIGNEDMGFTAGQ